MSDVHTLSITVCLTPEFEREQEAACGNTGEETSKSVQSDVQRTLPETEEKKRTAGRE